MNTMKIRTIKVPMKIRQKYVQWCKAGRRGGCGRRARVSVNFMKSR